MASGRRQIILTAEISADDMKEYVKTKAETSNKCAMLQYTAPMLLDEIIDGKTFEASLVYTTGYVRKHVSYGWTN